ncbi:hypothetical protein [Geobacter sp.]|uniref:hypothetical protein n=1 Tax=Geobacter sp. TaxID=46610 RepID=UPI0027B8893A|nr:hypothetical protein [Geobacter sp.]
MQSTKLLIYPSDRDEDYQKLAISMIRYVRLEMINAPQHILDREIEIIQKRVLLCRENSSKDLRIFLKNMLLSEVSIKFGQPSCSNCLKFTSCSNLPTTHPGTEYFSDPSLLSSTNRHESDASSKCQGYAPDLNKFESAIYSYPRTLKRLNACFAVELNARAISLAMLRILSAWHRKAVS